MLPVVCVDFHRSFKSNPLTDQAGVMSLLTIASTSPRGQQWPR